jgi:hypothetical protein
MSQFGDSTFDRNRPHSTRKERQALRALTGKPAMPKTRGKKFPNFRFSPKARPPMIRH